MGRFVEQIKLVWQRLETPQRVSIGLVLLAALGLVAFVAWGATRPDYRVLARDLDRAQVADIVAELEAQGVAYAVADGESTVLVPGSQVYVLRNQLAEKELLSAGSEGFGLLDDIGMGQSSMMEVKHYYRAVAGELENSFRELPGVQRARVIISKPRPSPFLDDDQQPSAAVKLQMAAGRRLDRRQVAGVVHLAAGAVEGLTPERVQVMDDRGLLSAAEKDPGIASASSNFELRNALEKRLVAKAQSQLDTLLGTGHSQVSVAVDLDFTRKRVSKSNPGSSAVLRSTTSSTESRTPVCSAGGVAGTAPNVENDGGTGTGQAPMAVETHDEETRENTVGKETTTIEEEVGRIRGMSVSIILDYKRQRVEAGEAGPGQEQRYEIEYVKRDPTELQQVQDVVLDAIGFRTAKGLQQDLAPDSENLDERFTVTVASLPFNRPEEEAAPAQAGLLVDLLAGWRGWGRYALAGLVALVLVLVARGQLRRARAAWSAEQERRREEAERLRSSLAAEEGEEAEHDAEATRKRQERQARRSRIQQQVDEDPQLAAQVLRTWLHDG